MVAAPPDRLSLRRTVLGVLTCCLLMAGCQSAEQRESTGAPQYCDGWPHWESFKASLISDDGRVIDSQAGDRTVSEGQAYALFFALVANDRPQFDMLLSWTERNLAAGDLSARLPAWLWGRDDQGNWGVLDTNPASDADLWLAYVLLEAGRLWQIPRYQALGELLAERILREETAVLPGLGLVLLPAPFGFTPEEGVWRLNPSYVPLVVVDRLAVLLPESPWPRLAEDARAFLLQSLVDGYAPDWVSYRVPGGMQRDADTTGRGSYDAIRVYLWAGMLPSQSDGRQELLDRLRLIHDFIRATGYPPEQFTPAGPEGVGSAGFSAAVLPYLEASGNRSLARGQSMRVSSYAAWEQSYYQQALRLFGYGWYSGAFRWDSASALLPFWLVSEC